MNPAQSESFWLSLFIDDIQKREGPHSSLIYSWDKVIWPGRRGKASTACVGALLQQAMKGTQEWQAALEQQLFALQRQLGNKWSAIAQLLRIDDNAVKNKFYSTLRRGLRKLNRYIGQVRRKRSATHLAANKFLKDEMLVKVNAVADRTHEDKYEVKQPALAVSQEIQQALIELAGVQSHYENTPGSVYDFEEKLLSKIQQFNRNCKRRKGKRKVRQQSEDSQEQQEARINSSDQVGLKVERSDATLHTAASINIQTSLDLNDKSEQKEEKTRPSFIREARRTIPPNADEQIQIEEILMQQQQRDGELLLPQALIGQERIISNMSPFSDLSKDGKSSINLSRFFQASMRAFAKEPFKCKEGNNLHISMSSFDSHFFNHQTHHESDNSFLEKMPNYIGSKLIESGFITKETMEEMKGKLEMQRSKSEARQKTDNEGNFILLRSSLPNMQAMLSKDTIVNKE